MPNAPVRVLHVIGSLECGGVETWVVQLISNLEHERIQVDVMVNRRGGMYEKWAKSSGIKVLCCGQPQSSEQYTANLTELLVKNGPYQVVHSHVQLLSGVVLRLAQQAGVPGRIAHARSTHDGQRGEKPSPTYQARMRYLIKRYATHLMAVSVQAAEGTFWKGVMKNGCCQLITGVDFAPFLENIDRGMVRAELEIPPGIPVVGHVGNFRPPKNYQFILEVAQEMLSQHSNMLFLLVGDGPLKSSVEEAARRLGLGKQIRFLGERTDVPRLLHAMDVFIFPSLFEGFGRVLLEAQAAGLPCVAADHIPAEVAAKPTSVRFMSLESGSKRWGQGIHSALQVPVSHEKGLAAIHLFEQRGLSIADNAGRLTQLYESIAGNPVVRKSDLPNFSS
jgi:glycosyltransferase involved in cell wall biosynthesis